MHLFLYEAPYIAPTHLVTGGRVPPPRRGTVLYLSAGSDPFPDVLVEATRLSRAAPAALLLVSRDIFEPLTGSQLESLKAVGVSGFFPNGGRQSAESVAAAARAAAESVKGQVTFRLGLVGRAIPRVLEGLIDVLMEGPPGTGVAGWARAAGESKRSLQRRFSEVWCAPSPRRWVELARSIHAVQKLQRSATLNVDAALAAAGLQRAQTGRDLLRKVCGASPVEIRQSIGWYWVVEHWQRVCWPAERGACLQRTA